MQGIVRPSSSVCARCLRINRRTLRPPLPICRQQSNTSASQQSQQPSSSEDGKQQVPPPKQEEEQQGALARRFEQLSEESLESGGRSARKAVQEAGFSDELKARLEEKIAAANFRNENVSAISQANMPSYAGRGTAQTATASPWTGTESMEDASLRMLNDAYKPLRKPAKMPGSVRTPKKIDTGQKASSKKAAADQGSRLASARDKASIYSTMLNDPAMSEKEKDKFREELKARFQPGARAVPSTIQGLASLANERIEDAIARGQFKNLKGRGKVAERDHNASNPFLDTTEYFMNKIIQKQEIVPPWIEKQQELVATATRFRSQLRLNWRRHVARSIAARGGGTESHVLMAEAYAFAEAVHNPARKKEETVHGVDNKGHLSQMTLSGELKAVPSGSKDGATDEDAGGVQQVEQEIKILEHTLNDDGTVKAKPDRGVIIHATQPDQPQPPPPSPTKTAVPEGRASVAPFRDTAWEATELSYHTAAINNLNTLTRSYNLMAPSLAKKPYFALDRELRSCFADVAPTVAAEIKQRALRPQIRGVETIGHTAGSVMERFDLKSGFVHDEDIKRKGYGFKEFWRDLFGAKTA